MLVGNDKRIYGYSHVAIDVAVEPNDRSSTSFGHPFFPLRKGDSLTRGPNGHNSEGARLRRFL